MSIAVQAQRLDLDMAARCAAGLLVIFFGWLGEPAVAQTAPEAASKHYQAAVKHVQQGDLRAAVVELKNALQGDPDNGDARLLLGNVYLQLGNGGAAEKELKAARRLGQDNSLIIVPLGRALLLQGHFERVLTELSIEEPDAQTGLELLLLAGDAKAGLGEANAARALYDQVTERDPGEPRAYVGRSGVALAEGNLVEAEAEAERALTRSPGLAEGLLLQAEARRLGGRPQTALTSFQQVLAAPFLMPATEVRARLGLTAVLLALGRDAEAEREVVALRTAAPGIPLATYLEALVRLRQQDFPAARDLLEAPALESFAPAQFLLGVVYYEAGELERARNRLLRYLNWHPDNLQARKLLAATLLRLNEAEEAVASLEIARAQAPEDPQVLLLLGNALLRQGRSADAALLLEHAATLAPDDPRVLSQLALSQMATGQRDEAFAALRATLDLGLDASAIGYAMAFANLRAGAFGDAVEITRDLRQRFPESALAANLEGAAYAGLGQYDNARTSFEAVLAIDPAFHEARANLAALKARAGDFAGAEAEYLSILRTAPSNMAALMGMAALAEQRGDREEVRRRLGRVVEAAPDAVQPSLALAEQHAMVGEVAAAVAVLEALAARQPRNPQVLLALGIRQRQAGQASQAVQTYERLVEVTDGSIAARRLLAESQLSAGDLDAAKRSYERLVAGADDDPVAWNNLAWLYHQTGDTRAASHGERALELAPAEPSVMDTLGWILLDDMSQLDRAVHLLGEAHRQAPDNGDIAYHYAVALHRSGDATAARDLLRGLLEQDERFASRSDAEALLSLLEP